VKQKEASLTGKGRQGLGETEKAQTVQRISDTRGVRQRRSAAAFGIRQRRYGVMAGLVTRYIRLRV
jgi:hypothetical protein